MNTLRMIWLVSLSPFSDSKKRNLFLELTKNMVKYGQITEADIDDALSQQPPFADTVSEWFSPFYLVLTALFVCFMMLFSAWNTLFIFVLLIVSGLYLTYRINIFQYQLGIIKEFGKKNHS